MRTIRTRKLRSAATAAAVAVTIGLVAACAPPPTGPTPAPLPGPTPDQVVQVTTDPAFTSRRPMSGDGGIVAYSQRTGFDLIDAFLWNASTGTTVPLTTGAADGAPAGSATDPPFVSSDGSTIVFTSTVPTIGGQPNTGNSVFRYTVGSGTTEHLEIPGTFGDGPIKAVSTSGDGSLMVVSYGDKVLTWTEASGFDELTDPTRLEEGGTAFSFSAVGAPVSDNGRYVTVMAIVPTTIRSGPGGVVTSPGLCRRPEVHDLDVGAVALGHCTDRGELEYLPPNWDAPTPILSTDDQGEVVYRTFGPIYSWSPSAGFAPVAGNQDSLVWTASADGNAVGYSPIVTSGGGLGIPTGSEGSGQLHIREPLARAVVGHRTRPVGIGTDAEKVLLDSNNIDTVGADPVDRRMMLYLWTRTG